MSEIGVVPQHGGGFGVIRQVQTKGPPAGPRGCEYVAFRPTEDGHVLEYADGAEVAVQRLAVFGTEEEAEAYRDEVRKEWG